VRGADAGSAKGIPVSLRRREAVWDADRADREGDARDLRRTRVPGAAIDREAVDAYREMVLLTAVAIEIARIEVALLDQRLRLSSLRNPIPHYPKLANYTPRHSHSGSSRSLASSQRETAPAPTNSATARMTASGCSNSRKCPARGRSITRTPSPPRTRSECPFPGGATSSSSPWIARRGASPPLHHCSRGTFRLVARCAIKIAGQHSTRSSIFGSDAGESQRAPRTVTQSLPFILDCFALRKAVPTGVGGPIRQPPATRVTLGTNGGCSTARHRAIRLPKACPTRCAGPQPIASMTPATSPARSCKVVPSREPRLPATPRILIETA